MGYIDMLLIKLPVLVFLFSLVVGTFIDNQYKIYVIVLAWLMIIFISVDSLSIVKSMTFSKTFKSIFKKVMGKDIRTDYGKEEEYISLKKVYKVYFNKFSMTFLYLLAIGSIVLIAYEGYYNVTYVFSVARFEIPYERFLLGLWIFWIVVLSSVNTHYRDDCFAKEAKPFFK